MIDKENGVNASIVCCSKGREVCVRDLKRKHSMGAQIQEHKGMFIMTAFERERASLQTNDAASQFYKLRFRLHHSVFAVNFAFDAFNVNISIPTKRTSSCPATVS